MPKAIVRSLVIRYKTEASITEEHYLSLFTRIKIPCISSPPSICLILTAKSLGTHFIMLITALRGFKIPITALSAFLAAHSAKLNFGGFIAPHERKALADFFKSILGEQVEAQVFIPQREGYSTSSIAYVAYTWVHIFVQREVHPQDLLEEAPIKFQQMRIDMMELSDTQLDMQDPAFGKISQYIVFAGNDRWTPPILSEREKVS